MKFNDSPYAKRISDPAGDVLTGEAVSKQSNDYRSYDLSYSTPKGWCGS